MNKSNSQKLLPCFCGPQTTVRPSFGTMSSTRNRGERFSLMSLKAMSSTTVRPMVSASSTAPSIALSAML